MKLQQARQHATDTNIDEQANGVKLSPEVGPHAYRQLSVSVSTRVQGRFNKERMTFSINGPRTVGYLYTENELRFIPAPGVKVNSEWIRVPTLTLKLRNHKTSITQLL